MLNLIRIKSIGFSDKKLSELTNVIPETLVRKFKEPLSK